ncbi:MAG: GNAT family N-acetyltransferase [Hyphomicrobiales bacterium]
MEDHRDLSFCTASQKDARALADLRVEAMRESLEAVGRFDPDRARARFLKSFEPEATTRILKAGRLVGFFALKRKSDYLLLDHLYIDDDLQGIGLGSQVMKLAKAQANEASLPIELCALKGSAANGFYEGHGFCLIRSDALDNYYRFSLET